MSSKNSLKSSKSQPEFGTFKIGTISEAISSAFGNPVHIPQPSPKAAILKKLAGFKAKTCRKDFFLTEAEMYEIKAKRKLESKDLLSYEEMIKELDTMTNGIKSGADDLADLKKRIERCQAGLENKEMTSYGLDRSVKEISLQHNLLMLKVQSLSSLPRFRKTFE